MRRLDVTALLVLLACILGAGDASREIAGRSQVTFSERSPLSLWPEMARRFQWRGRTFPEPYKIEEQTFEAYVPAKETLPADDARYGLLVWINAGDEGGPTDAWLPVLDKHHLIWIGANRGGNEHPPAERFALALDAAGNMLKRYPIDETRVYLAGISGGGRCASMVAPMYPDVFRGAIYIVGCNYFHEVPVPDQPGMVWRAHFRPPLAKYLKLAQERSRFVFLTGEKDMNRAETQATCAQGYRKDGFRHAHYLEVAGMGHELPSAEWFDKALTLLAGDGANEGDDPNRGAE